RFFPGVAGRTTQIERFRPQPFVMPAKAGIQQVDAAVWIPAFAGMTSERSCNRNRSVWEREGLNAHDRRPGSSYDSPGRGSRNLGFGGEGPSRGIQLCG